MNYKSKLLPASFRGVNFGVKDINTTMGRRTVLHEYPLRNDPYAEDLGRKAREYTINAFVMNPDDYSASQDLASALEDYDTPGTLVHPTLGAIQVVPKECTHTYSSTEGGIEYFQVIFVETSGNNLPSTTLDTQGFARSSANALLSSSAQYFASNFKVAGYADFLADAAIQNLNTFAAKFRGLINFGSARNGNPGQYSKLIASLNDFTTDIPNLVFTPQELADRLNQLNKDLNASFVANLGLAMLIQSRLWEYGDDFAVIIATTNLRLIQGNNQDLIIYLVKASVIAEMVRNVSQMIFLSEEDATSVRDSVDEKGWALLEELADNFQDDIYTSLLTTLNAMIQDVSTRTENAASVRTYLTKDKLPVLRLAYEYLDDASMDQAVIDRNQIINPLFVPNGTPIKVVQ